MCTCGNPTPHEIARRATMDGTMIRFWSDGTLSGQWHYLPGIGRKRLPEAALWALAGEVCITTAAEMPSRFRAHREGKAGHAPQSGALGQVARRRAEHVRDCRKIGCRTCL